MISVLVFLTGSEVSGSIPHPLRWQLPLCSRPSDLALPPAPGSVLSGHPSQPLQAGLCTCCLEAPAHWLSFLNPRVTEQSPWCAVMDTE